MKEKNRTRKRSESVEEKVYKCHGTSPINFFTLFFLVITILTAMYVNMDKIRTQTNSESNKDVSLQSKSSAEQLQDTPPLPDNNIVNEVTSTEDNMVVRNNTENENMNNMKQKKSGKDTITNSYDKNIVKELNKGEQYLKQKQYQECISHFEKLYKRYTLSPRAVYGQAMCLDKLSEQMRSNELLMKAISAYGEVAKQPNVTPKLLKLSVTTQAKRYIFLGHARKAVIVLTELSKRIPKDTQALNELGMAYMMMGAQKQAYQVFKQVLDIDKTDGVANSHVGFILKAELKFADSISYLQAGVRSGAEGADDAKFYFHLGDAYNRLHQETEAWKVYHEAAEKKIFLSAQQRSLYNSKTKLRAQPWWTDVETGYQKQIRFLEDCWETIRDEGLNLLKKNQKALPLETENLLEKGDWRQFQLYSRGHVMTKNCARTPRTCEILKSMPDAITNKRGQIKYSVMQPGTHIWPHTGPTNCRLRAHLGLVIPNDVYIRAGSKTRTWQNGKVLIFDDSFDHEVWHNGTTARMIFIVDFWHPDLPKWEKDTLSAI